MKIKINRYGLQGILVTWPSEIDNAILEEIIQFIEIVKTQIAVLSNLHHGYHEVLLQYKSPIPDFEIQKSTLLKCYKALKISGQKKANIWEVPVCYDPTLAPNLPQYLKDKNISLDNLITLHTQVEYVIHFIGFLPGFLYLGGMDESLSIPRKSIPSPLVRQGTVAIGGKQTGVYPQDSPGGWYGIGYTPISFFEANQKPPVWAKPGDKLRFYAVDLGELAQIKINIANASFQFKSLQNVI